MHGVVLRGHRPSHPYKAETAHVRFSSTRHTMLASAEGGGVVAGIVNPCLSFSSW